MLTVVATFDSAVVGIVHHCGSIGGDKQIHERIAGLDVLVLVAIDRVAKTDWVDEDSERRLGRAQLLTYTLQAVGSQSG